tara:strand:- start:164 stop:517 length:354 start_codon:yes stop_codon:yes gene_type:complete
MTNINHSINYIEFPLVDPSKTKAFYAAAFGWTFTDWGPDYISFSGAGVEGGFNRERRVSAGAPGVLVILYAEDLAATERQIVDAGGEISTEAYAFPGGRRFHFTDPNENELAVWSER